MGLLGSALTKKMKCPGCRTVGATPRFGGESPFEPRGFLHGGIFKCTQCGALFRMTAFSTTEIRGEEKRRMEEVWMREFGG